MHQFTPTEIYVMVPVSRPILIEQILGNELFITSINLVFRIFIGGIKSQQLRKILWSIKDGCMNNDDTILTRMLKRDEKKNGFNR